MGLQIYVELEKSVLGLMFSLVEGKDLARALGEPVLAPLTQFCSVTAAQLEDLAEEWEEIAPPGEPLPQVQWFEAAPGLATVEQVLLVLRTDLGALENADENAIEGVIEDLNGIAQDLRQAVKHEIRFHLATTF